jgi:hypothetical protein
MRSILFVKQIKINKNKLFNKIITLHYTVNYIDINRIN